MAYFGAAVAFIFTMIAYVMIKVPRAQDLPYDYDEPRLIESGRHVRETKAEIRARHDADREAMVA